MVKDDLKELIKERNEQKELEKNMTPEEKMDLQREKAKIQELFRDDQLEY